MGSSHTSQSHFSVYLLITLVFFLCSFLLGVHGSLYLFISSISFHTATPGPISHDSKIMQWADASFTCLPA